MITTFLSGQLVDGTSPTTIVIAYLATVFVTALSLYAFRQALSGQKSQLLPGPIFHFPIFGDSILLGTGNPLIFFFNRYKRYGPVFRTKMLGSRIWVVADWAALRAPLNDQGAALEIPFASFKALMGESLVKNPRIHAPWRKVLTAATSGSQLAAIFPRVLAVMKAHVVAWEQAGGKINIFRAARVMGVDLAVDAIVQVQLPDQVDRAWFKQQVEVFLDGVYSLPIRLPGTPLHRSLAARERLLDALEPAVAGPHREFMEQWSALGNDSAQYAQAVMERHEATGGAAAPAAAPLASASAPFEGTEEATAPTAGPAAPAAAPAPASGALRPSILTAQMLIRASLNQCDLRDAGKGVLNSLVASGDTTRFALFNTWSLLAMSPRVQDKVYEEQRQIIAQYGEELSYQAVSSMPYLDAVVKECMRLLPASTGGMRRLTEDLRVGKYVIPKGEMILYNSNLMHCLDPVLWDGDTSAEVPAHMDWRNNLEGAFKPERWLGAGGGTGGELPRPRYFVTFGSGSHLCIGMNLVYMEIKTLLALVLRKYRLQLETPDMLLRCKRLFPFFVPAPGTDGVLLVPRQPDTQAAP